MDPQSGPHTYEPHGAQDAFFTEYDTTGDWVRTRAWGGYNDDDAVVMGDALCLDDNHDIIIAGRFDGTVDFNPLIFTEALRTSTPGSWGDIYISKFGSNGIFSGVIQLSGTYQDAGINGIAVDMYENIYVCGYFEDTCDFDPGTGIAERTAVGSYDMFLAKYNNNLEYVWVQTWGSTDYESFKDVAYDRTYNYIYVVGLFDITLDFDPGEGVYEMTPADERDPFLMRLLSNGTWEY
jgi:hypothetical protein